MTMACSDDERPSDLPDEVGRTSDGAVPPIAPMCGHPCPEGHQRRDLCVSCYRKLGEAGALPPKRAEHRDRVHPLRRWLGTLDNATLVLLAAWIADIQRAPR